MPQNSNLKPVDLPMELKFGREPQTRLINNLDALKIELVDSPTRQQAWNVAWHYVKATWADRPDIHPEVADPRDLSQNLVDVFAGRTLPAPMECLGFTFRLSGLSFQDVTHIIRHRAGTFAAQCTGDRDLRDDDAVVPEPVENSPEFYARWKKIVEDSKQLYADMTDSKVVSMMDARMILPKCMTSFYYMRLSLKDLIGFIFQRQDVQIQPESDNIMAIKMAIEVCNVIPEFTTLLDFNKPDMHYIKTFRVKEGDKFISRGTNLYWPEPKNDKFEYHPSDSIYQARREELNGTHGSGEKKFTKMWRDLNGEFDSIRRDYNEWKENK
jgi:Thymidylate synthase complementing protein